MRRPQAKALLTQFTDRHPISCDDQKAPEFYDEIATQFNFIEPPQQPIGLIVVAHLVHTLPHFLHALTQLGTVVSVIPKDSQYVPEVEATLRKLYQEWLPHFTDDTSKPIPQHSIKNILTNESAKVQYFFQTLIKKYADHRFMIIDHGGYFAPCLDILIALQDKIVGIFEHTWNGEIRYRKQLYGENWAAEQPTPLQQLSFTLASIARTRLKAYEDAHVATSIVNAMNAQIFGGLGINQDISRRKIGIIGYGHMGAAVARHLLKIVANEQLMICDTDPNKQRLAQNFFKTVYSDQTQVLEKCDIVIVAANQQVLGKAEFAKLKSNACIICVTSCDDLFQDDAKADLKKSRETPSITTYKRQLNDKIDEIHLAFDGKSVNFSIGSTPHPVLHAVFASVYVSIVRYFTAAAGLTPSIQEIPTEDIVKIRNTYERIFGSLESQIETFGLYKVPNHFVGRQTELNELREVLQNHSIGCITQSIEGRGGAGKSTLAQKYAEEALKDQLYYFAAQLDASTTKTLYRDFMRLALQLGISTPEQKTPQALVDAVYHRLRIYQRFLLIFDNSDKLETLEQGSVEGEKVNFLPQHHIDQLAHCIITTRTQDYTRDYNGLVENRIPLGALAPAEACAYIKHYLVATDEQAQKLAALVHYFPLALRHMVNYLLTNRSEITIDDYLKTYEVSPRAPDSSDFHHAVYTTWKISFDKLNEKHPTASELLEIMSFFNTSSIPLFLLKLLEKDEVLADDIETLQKYSLVDWEKETESLQIHGLVQEVTWQHQARENRFHSLNRLTRTLFQHSGWLDQKLMRAEELGGFSLTQTSLLISHVVKALDFHQKFCPTTDILNRAVLLRSIADTQNYRLRCSVESITTYTLAETTLKTTAVEDGVLLGNIRIGLINASAAWGPSRFVAQLDRFFAAQDVNIQDLLRILEGYRRAAQGKITQEQAKQLILKSQVGQSFLEHPECFLAELSVDDFFKLLFSFKDSWLASPDATKILKSFGIPELFHPAVKMQLLQEKIPNIQTVCSKLESFGIRTTPEQIKQAILQSGVSQFIGQHVRQFLENLPPDDFFTLLFSVKSLWLSYIPQVLDSLEVPEFAIVYLIFKGQTVTAEQMANAYLARTRPRTFARVEALCLLVAARIFGGNFSPVEDIQCLLEASNILEDEQHVNQFFDDQVHYMLSVLYATIGNFSESEKVIFKLLEKMIKKNSERGVEQRIDSMLEMTKLLEEKFAATDATSESNASKIKQLLAENFRIAARLLVILKNSKKASGCFMASLTYDSNSAITQYEYAVQLAKYAQTRSEAREKFGTLNDTSFEYSYFEREIASGVLPRAMKKAFTISDHSNQPIPIEFLSKLFLAWMDLKNHELEACQFKLSQCSTGSPATAAFSLKLALIQSIGVSVQKKRSLPQQMGFTQQTGSAAFFTRSSSAPPQLSAVSQETVIPGTLLSWKLEQMQENNNFYHAVIAQMQLQQNGFEEALVALSKAPLSPYENLRLKVQGVRLQNQEWSAETIINTFIIKFDVVLAIADAEYSTTRFSYRYLSENGKIITSEDYRFLPEGVPVLQLMMTDQRFLPFQEHAAMEAEIKTTPNSGF